MPGQLTFRFSLGPVQGFIAQARRTRDLWAGSFLLSWLTATAMVEVRRQVSSAGPEFGITFPVVDDDPMVMALEGKGGTPDLATIPNQFKAVVPAQGFDPDAVAAGVRRAWADLAEVVRIQFLAGLADDSREIWNRQIGGFWDVSWVLGEADGTEETWLAARKNWRSHRPPEQGGETCTLMGDWQEISGYVRATRRREQDVFWSKVRRSVAAGSDLGINLREGERLCAIALVKRLFPLLDRAALERAIGWVPGGTRHRVSAWPSTGQVAASRWLAEAASHPEVNVACARLARHVEVNLHACHFGEQHARILEVASLGHEAFSGSRFHELDATLLRRDDLDNAVAYGLIGKRGEDSENERPELLRLQTEVAMVARDAGLPSEPRPYYAVLLMDGDHVGHLLDGRQDAKVSDALASFTRQVCAAFDPAPGGTGRFNGVVIYAGTDDVLALVTVEDVVTAAGELADSYRSAFEVRNITLPQGSLPDVSAAIVFADHGEPFRDVLAEARRLLEQVAKGDNERSSLAVSVLKPSGCALEWACKWRIAGGVRPSEALLSLVRNQDAKQVFSSSFLYNLRSRYLAPAGDHFAVIGYTRTDIEAIFRHAMSRADRDGSAPRTGDYDPVPDLLRVTRPRKSALVRTSQHDPGEIFEEDGLMLLRFLVQYGMWS